MTKAALTLVGWDDILCRPIYRRTDPAPAKKQQQRDKKKSDVILGTSNNSMMFRQPPTPDGFKHGYSGEIYSDDVMFDDGSKDEIVEGSKFRHQSRRSSTSKLIQKPFDDDSLSSAGCSDFPKTNGDSCPSSKSAASVDDDHINLPVNTDDSSDSGSNFNQTDGFEQCDNIGTKTLSHTSNNTEVDVSNCRDDGSHSDSTASATDDSFGQSSNGKSSVRSQPDSSRGDIGHLSEHDKQKHVNSIDSKTGRRVDLKSTLCVEESPNKEVFSSSFEADEFDLVSVREKLDDRDEPIWNRGTDADQPILSCTASQDSASPAKPIPSDASKPTSSLVGSTGTMKSASNSKQFILHSPMLLECNRGDFEPSDTDTVNISPCNPGSKDVACAARRSYGQTNRSSWAKSSNEYKATGSELGQKQLDWDDVKCRPIYHVRRPEPTHNNEPQEDSTVCNASGKDDQVTTVQIRLHKRRAYSSSFRKSGLFKAARHDMDLDSTNLRRVTDQAGDCSSSANAKDCVDDSIAFELESDASSSKSQDESESDDEVENAIQPTSKSTIESARAFFRYMDSHHRLTVTTSNEIYAKTSVIRTTRRITHSNRLREEYDAYCQIVVDASGINPISIDDFAMHWNMYFTEKGIIRDGLLDE
jgi:hypothetical protein